jgi:hypothetical protein
MTVLSVLGLFMLRIGGPLLLLVGLGILIDRWQRKREQEIRRQYGPKTGQKDAEVEEDEQIRKAA